METPRRPPRPAVALLNLAARRWPADLREQLHRSWLGELHAIAADPDTGQRAQTWRALRFALSLAVRRPAPSAVGVAPVVAARRPAWELFGAVLGLALVGTLAAMLLVHLPGAVADRLADPDGSDGVHRLPLLALVPTLVVIGVLLGRRVARRDTPRNLARTVGIIVTGLLCALLFPIFGGIVTALPGVLVWAAGLFGSAQMAARLARRPRGPLPWVALALGGLMLADIAVTSAVWLSLGPDQAPRAYALTWFPAALLDTAAKLPMGTDAAYTEVLDVTEFLPHALIITTAFTLAYVHATAARANALS